VVVDLVLVGHGVVLWWVVVDLVEVVHGVVLWWVVVDLVEVVHGVVDTWWCSDEWFSTGRIKSSPRACITPAKAGLAARATRAMEGIISRN
jgi:hypothetical protein